MKKTVLIKIATLVEIEEDDLKKDFGQLQKLSFKLSKKIDEALEVEESSCLGWQSESSIILDEKEMNCGKCAICDAWVTDREKPNFIQELNIGALYEGKLLCDEHLPENHRWAF